MLEKVCLKSLQYAYDIKFVKCISAMMFSTLFYFREESTVWLSTQRELVHMIQSAGIYGRDLRHSERFQSGMISPTSPPPSLSLSDLL